jgi:hypothetical protein
MSGCPSPGLSGPRLDEALSDGAGLCRAARESKVCRDFSVQPLHEAVLLRSGIHPSDRRPDKAVVLVVWGARDGVPGNKDRSNVFRKAAQSTATPCFGLAGHASEYPCAPNSSAATGRLRRAGVDQRVTRQNGWPPGSR